MLTSPSEKHAVVAAYYYDGRSASRREVSLSIEDRELILDGADFLLRWPLIEVRISERLGSTPRLLIYSGGGHCEVSDLAGLTKLLAQTGAKKSLLDRLQHSLAWAGAALLLTVLIALAAYKFFLPWSAEKIARRIPAQILREMGSSTLNTLDARILRESKLETKRRQRLTMAYASLKSSDDQGLPSRILFRSSPLMGANAFALPDGSIVLLDELLARSEDDNEILAVLAHERGHVERRHALRILLQSSVVGLTLAWLVGDLSSLLATAPAVIIQAKYSRDMEREADAYAEQTLRANGLSPALLASILAKLEASRPAGANRGKNSLLDYLSSHPGTEERTGKIMRGPNSE